MRFLVANHLRLGAMPGDIPGHTCTDLTAFSTRAAWMRAVEQAVQADIHALFLTGDIIAATNPGLEPFGPLVDGITRLQQAGIPVVAVADGRLTPETAHRYRLNDAVHFLEGRLDWEPPIITGREAIKGPGIHIVSASLAESDDSPVAHPLPLADIDQAHSMWILTEPLQPDTLRGEHALVIEPGATAPLTSEETGTHGAWLVDTDTFEATLLPLASLEYAAIAIDVQPAQNREDVERIIAQALLAAADRTHAEGSVHTLVVHCTLTGATRLYPALAEIAGDLRNTLTLQHAGITIVISRIEIDAKPEIDLQPLIARPDPVGEVARLLHALTAGEEPGESQSRLMAAVEQKLLAVRHARLFGAIVDTPLSADADTLLQRQAWATLDTMVRQRGIDE